MASIDGEIARLETLRKSHIDVGKETLVPMMLLETMGLLTDEQTQRYKVRKTFYMCTDVHLVHKIKFWKQYQTREMEANMLTKMNETMTEWIEAGWEFLGQADIKQKSEEVKEEYNMFKVMFERCKIVPVGKLEVPVEKPLCRNCEIETKKHCDDCGGYGSDDDDEGEEEEQDEVPVEIPLCRNCKIEKHDKCKACRLLRWAMKPEVEVFEHKLSDGTDVLKGHDGILYDKESLERIGTLNEEDNTLVKVDYVFRCTRCGVNIERNSKEHDECTTKDGKKWFCGECS
jgi:hypothetical protein